MLGQALDIAALEVEGNDVFICFIDVSFQDIFVKFIKLDLAAILTKVKGVIEVSMSSLLNIVI